MVPDRALLIDSFLSKTPWATSRRAPLAGDASNRRYLRLHLDGNSAVLMDAPPEKGEDVRPFVTVANHLRSLGLSAPGILAVDTDSGFLLLQDLGDDLFARVVLDQPDLETTLYEAATDALVTLHDSAAPQSLQDYGPVIMAEMAAHAYRWYRRGADLSFQDEAQGFEEAFQPLLNETCGDRGVLIQRDYHAENLLWLPERYGVARVGLLDFQDAMRGHKAYDLVSLLKDARRDVPEAIEETMIARYLSKTGLEPDGFRAAYAVLGVQRNLRILGVFARLSMHFGKPHYIDFIPRVWAYLLRDLGHPALGHVRDMVLRDLPEPSPALLTKLKDKCGTIPTL